MDIGGAHTKSKLFSNGEDGIYYNQDNPNDVADHKTAALFYFLGEQNYPSGVNGPTRFKVGDFSAQEDQDRDNFSAGSWRMFYLRSWSHPVQQFVLPLDQPWDPTDEFPVGTQYNLNHPIFVYGWEMLNIPDGQVATRSIDMGLREPGFFNIVGDKSYKNITSSSGKNNVGDKIKYSISFKNESLKSSFGTDLNWDNVEITDRVPNGLSVDTSSFVLTNPDGSTKKLPSTAYDASTRELKASLNRLEMNKEVKLDFTATISPSAGSSITNKVVAKGTDLSLIHI